MPAVSKSQQKLFGLAHAVQQGKVPASKVSGAAKDIAKNVKKREVKKFASTPTKNLPDRVKKEMKETVAELVKEILNETPDSKKYMLQQKLKAAREKRAKLNAQPPPPPKKTEGVVNEARTIGAIKIKKLKALTTEMWKRNHDVSEDEIIDKIPSDWWETWESADSEIRRLVSDTITDLTHNESVTPKKTQLEILEGKLGRPLSVPEKHQLAIAYKTVKMPEAMVGVMGGMTIQQAKDIIEKLTGKKYEERKTEAVKQTNKYDNKFRCPKCHESDLKADSRGMHHCPKCGYKEKEADDDEHTMKDESKGFKVDGGVPVKESFKINPSLPWLIKLTQKNTYSIGPVTILIAGSDAKRIIGINAVMLTNPSHPPQDANRHIEAALDGITGLKDTIYKLDKIAPHKTRKSGNSIQKLWLLPMDAVQPGTQKEGMTESVVNEADSEAGRKAKQLGLDYMKFGRYGKKGKVTHKIENGKLVPFSGAEPDKKGVAPKQTAKVAPQGTAPKIDKYGKENDPSNWWRDAFHSRHGRVSKEEMAKMVRIHPDLTKAFKSLYGDYIEKDKEGNYVWPMMIDLGI